MEATISFHESGYENLFYNGPKIDIIAKANLSTLTITDVESVIEQVQKHGIKITNHPGAYSGIDDEGTGYTINFEKDAPPTDKLHELIHFEQDMDAMASGVDKQEIASIPIEVRCLYEIQASRLTLKYLDKWEIADENLKLQEVINLKESKRQLRQLGLKVPNVINNPWNTYKQTFKQS